jgi:hypothetical protein
MGIGSLRPVTEIQRHLADFTTTAAPDSQTPKRTKKTAYQWHHYEPATFALRGELQFSLPRRILFLWRCVCAYRVFGDGFRG